MSQQFERIRSQLQEVSFDFISVHIPKTAGTSFWHTLQKIYRKSEIIRLDMGPRVGLSINKKAYTETTRLPPQLRAIHGHFRVKHLVSLYADGVEADIPFVTWVRDPVERVISNYHYLSKRFAEELDESGKQLNILSKMQRNLMEYARLPRAQNMMSRVLRGYPLEQFKFVGIQEHYAEDLAYLAKCYNWPKLTEYKHNITGKAYKVSKAEKEEIRTLNALDCELYEKALVLRQHRT